MKKPLVLAVILFSLAMPAAVSAQQPDKVAQAQALKQQADNAMKDGKRQEAIGLYKQSLALDPKNWQTHDSLGNAYFKEKMFLDAAMEYGEAMLYNQGYVAGYYNMAYSYRKAGRYGDAIKNYEKYIKMKPDDTDAYYGLAESYKAVGEKPPAIENYQLYIQKEKRPSEQKWIDKARASIIELGGTPPHSQIAAAPAPTPVQAPAPAPPSKPPAAPAAAVVPAPVPGPAPAPVVTASSAKPVTAAPSSPAPSAAKSAASAPVAPVMAATAPKPPPLPPPSPAPSPKPAAAPAPTPAATAPAPKPAPAPAPATTVAVAPKPVSAPPPAPTPAPAPPAAPPPAAPAPAPVHAPPPPVPSAPAPVAKPAPPQSPPPPAPAPAPVVATAAPAAPASSPPPPPTPVQGEDPLVAEGDAHFKAGAYHNAITTYRDAISRNPNNPEAHYKLALALAITGRLDAAVAEWKIVVQLDPSNQGARDNIARAEARLYGTPAPVAAAPPPPTPPPKQGPDIDDLFLKAVQANNQGDYQTAANVIDELLRIKQDHAKAYVVRGDAMLGLGQMDEAVKSYNSAMVFDPGLSSPLFGLAESYRLLANREKSVHYYKLFLQSNDPGKDKWRADRAARMLEIMDGEK